MDIGSDNHIRVYNEAEPDTGISVTAAQSVAAREAQHGLDQDDDVGTISEHQEEYDNASSAPGSIGGDHEIRSEKPLFKERQFK